MRVRPEAVHPNPRGLYECVHCGREFVTPIGAALCCDTDYDDREDSWR